MYPVEIEVSLFISLIKRLNRKKKNVPMYGTRFCSITKLTVAVYQKKKTHCGFLFKNAKVSCERVYNFTI